MSSSLILCSYCNKNFFKDNRHINENLKLGHKFYCSIQCQSSFKNKQMNFRCQNPNCNKEFIKRRFEISTNNYCSRSCAVTVNNTKFPKKRKEFLSNKYCKCCGIRIIGCRKYCSMACQQKSQCIVSKEDIISKIQKFYINNDRIPLKREFNHYSVARKHFGNWNNAIITAGFKPNPVMFADRCIAIDGHSCDSIAEKLIDDYLFKRGISHERSISYPEGKYTADFRIGTKWIEYFGLAGEHRRYDELRAIKQRLARKYKLMLIQLYPKDLYPQSRLEEILGY